MKLLCLLNFPSHYREHIYLKLEEEFNCDFVFGFPETLKSIKKIDKNKFSKPYVLLKTVFFGRLFNHIKGSLKFSFKDYSSYLLTGEYFCLSVWFLLIFNKLQNKKTYLWTHAWYGNEGFLKKQIKKIFLNLADGIFLYGNYAKELMIDEGFDAAKLHVIYNSLDYDFQLSFRNKLEKNNIYKNYFENDYPVVLFIGRLSLVKKLDMLIKSQHILKEDFKFNIIYLGDGEVKSDLVKLASNLSLSDRNWFYGSSYKEEEISNLIFNADLCVSPGNIGLTAMHSLMYGTPVLTHNNFSNQMPEFEVIEDGKTGFFFKENDLDDLASKLKDALGIVLSAEFDTSNCYKSIDKYYNPAYQLKIFREVLCF